MCELIIVAHIIANDDGRYPDVGCRLQVGCSQDRSGIKLSSSFFSPMMSVCVHRSKRGNELPKGAPPPTIVKLQTLKGEPRNDRFRQSEGTNNISILWEKLKQSTFLLVLRSKRSTKSIQKRLSRIILSYTHTVFKRERINPVPYRTVPYHLPYFLGENIYHTTVVREGPRVWPAWHSICEKENHKLEVSQRPGTNKKVSTLIIASECIYDTKILNYIIRSQF